ncbi:hypothetical protein SDC9_20602 [bioreactor metagenome]|uniref:Uncharacterized protein n=1 Tax=bioreactor metagenome TaxID=1076179 RepID=A0A644U764_9ZZZZ
MPHQDAARAQRLQHLGRPEARRGRKDEVRGRGQHRKAAGLKPRGQPRAVGHHLVPRLVEPGRILPRRQRARERQPVERVGVEAVLDPGEPLDQRGLAKRKAHPQPGKTARLREGLHHQKVFIARDQRRHAVGAEIDIGLVDQHHDIGVCLQHPLDRGHGQGDAGRRVRIGDHDARAGAGECVDVEAEIGAKRHLPERDAVERAIGRVEAVGHVGKEQFALAAEEGVEGMGQHLVRAVAGEDMIGVQAEARADRRAQRRRRRVRVKPQRVAGRGPDRLDRAGGGAIGVLVGIELDEGAVRRLLARRVGNECRNPRAPEPAHAAPPLVAVSSRNLAQARHRDHGEIGAQRLIERSFCAPITTILWVSARRMLLMKAAAVTVREPAFITRCAAGEPGSGGATTKR